MWIDTCIPNTIEELSGFFKYAGDIHTIIKTGSHILLNGACGVGKYTTTMLSLREIGVSPDDILVLTSNMEKPIEVLHSFLKTGIGDKKYVIVKNILSSVKGIQHKISSYMDYKRNVRFILLLEDDSIHSVIEGVLSRCLCINVPFMDTDTNKRFLTHVMNTHGVPTSTQTNYLQPIITQIPHDLRKQLLTIEVLCNRVSQSGSYDYTTFIPDSITNMVVEYLDCVLTPDTNEESESRYHMSCVLLNNIMDSGIEYTDFLDTLLKCVGVKYMNRTLSIPNHFEPVVRIIGDTQIWFTRGLASMIQLDVMTMKLYKLQWNTPPINY